MCDDLRHDSGGSRTSRRQGTCSRQAASEGPRAQEGTRPEARKGARPRGRSPRSTGSPPGTRAASRPAASAAAPASRRSRRTPRGKRLGHARRGSRRGHRWRSRSLTPQKERKVCYGEETDRRAPRRSRTRRNSHGGTERTSRSAAASRRTSPRHPHRRHRLLHPRRRHHRLLLVGITAGIGEEQAPMDQPTGASFPVSMPSAAIQNDIIGA